MVHVQRLIVNQVPIRYGDEIVGAVGIALFTEAKQILSLAKSLFSINLGSDSMSPHHWTPHYSRDDIIGPSPTIASFREKIGRAAQTLATVLIVGESDTGKAVVDRKS